MHYECIGLNGFAGDRTPYGMQACHPLATAIGESFSIPVTLHGQTQSTRDLSWDAALHESQATFHAAAQLLDDCFKRGKKPLLITPRCATAIATLPVVISNFPEAVIVNFDAHGDLNTPQTSNSSYLGGMPITAAMGIWDSGYGSGLTAENLVHIGGRDFDESELEFISERKILAFFNDNIEKNLQLLKEKIRQKPVFIHIDTDVFDPTEVVAEYSVNDGLFRQHIHSVLQVVHQAGTLIGMEITEFSPKNTNEQLHSHKAILDALNSLKQ